MLHTLLERPNLLSLEGDALYDAVLSLVQEVKEAWNNMEEFNRKTLGLYVLLEDIRILKAYLRKQKEASAVQEREATHELERCRDHLNYNRTALSRYAEPIRAKYEELKINLDAVIEELRTIEDPIEKWLSSGSKRRSIPFELTTKQANNLDLAFEQAKRIGTATLRRMRTEYRERHYSNISYALALNKKAKKPRKVVPAHSSTTHSPSDKRHSSSHSSYAPTSEESSSEDRESDSDWRPKNESKSLSKSSRLGSFRRNLIYFG